MSNKNPFRKNPSVDVQQAVEDWGKSKFKPTKFKSGNNDNRKPFNGMFSDGKGNFRRNGEKFRFNEVAKDAKPENSTPWNKYKDEIIFQQRDEEQAALQANFDSNEAKAVLKQREIIYRKSLVEQKKKETTKWEDFGEDAGDFEKGSHGQTDDLKHKGKQFKKFQLEKEKAINTQSKTNFKKKILNCELKLDKREFISKDLLQNFDSKKLSYEQNDKLRSVITKTTILASGTTLQRVVNEMKKKKKKP